MMTRCNSSLGLACALSGVWLATAAVGCLGAQSDPPTSGPVPAAGGAAPAPALVPIDARDLAVSSGEITPDGPTRFSIRSPTLRAELGRAPRSAAELAFVYQGPTHGDAPLASGELRRQIGLKLRAQDGCNVIYVMWHIEPSPGIVVSVKSNPGQSRHAECGDRGYSFLEPTSSRPAPPIAPGEPHVLGAEIRSRVLLVKTDGEQSWQGELPSTAFHFDGPVGVRADNGEFSAELRAEELIQ
jgi:hypothetical protein